MVTVLVLTAGLTMGPAEAGPARPAVRPVTTIAIVGDSAINPLHVEFRTRDGRDPAYPVGMPRPVRVPLPRATSFDEAIAELARGPLGSPVPGTLYSIGGTRLLLYAASGGAGLLAPGDGRLHGTGTAAAAGGSRTGTSPDSLVVFVPGGGDAAYGWVARQRWIDVASTSVYTIPTTGQCAGTAGARALHRDGGLLFSSSGNLYDYYEPLASPNGLPEVYQVGGVDGTGRTWLPPHPEEEQPFFALANVVRPYETGGRFSFATASGDSTTGTQPFGGTSGATPTVAGYAAELVAEARRLFGDAGPRDNVALATARPARRVPSTGPLADGLFTRDELVDVLHRTAVPHEAVAAGRYAVEGYGATDARSHRSALQVLRGQSAMPVRVEEGAAHAQAESARGWQASRC